jgi:hypothetical protein
MKQDSKQFHHDASRARRRPGCFRLDISRQAFAAGNDGKPVQVEKRKAGEVGPFHHVTGLPENGSNLCPVEVLPMANVPVEGGHRPARHRNN